MKRRKERIQIFISVLMMLLLIWDTRFVVLYASKGIELCLKTVIPSLFPFFIVSSYLNSVLQGHSVPLIHPLQKVLNISSSTASLLLLGLTGGYPVGAQLISQAYRDQQISDKTGYMLLGYCNNSGPAFIWGIAGMMFTSGYIPLLLWGIQIFSAILTGYLLPRPEYGEIRISPLQKYSVTDALKKSISNCSVVCGWIILFKIVLGYINFILVGNLSLTVRTIITGLLELSNGCLQLADISSEALRFTICSALLSFGGLCVLFQTISATQDLGLGLYIPGKIMQTSISTITAASLSFMLFPDETTRKPYYICILICTITLIITKELAKKYGKSLINSVYSH